MTNKKNSLDELGRGTGVFCIAQRVPPPPTHSSVNFTQADPKELGIDLHLIGRPIHLFRSSRSVESFSLGLGSLAYDLCRPTLICPKSSVAGHQLVRVIASGGKHGVTA